MTGATIAIDDAAVADTILSVKRRVFAANRELPVRRQRLVYRPGPHGMEALADDETLGGAGVARDGSAELDVLLAELTEEEMAALGEKVLCQRTECHSRRECASCICAGIAPIFYMQFIFLLILPNATRILCTQFLKAAESGRSRELTELMGEGTDIEFKSQVHLVFCVL